MKNGLSALMFLDTSILYYALDRNEPEKKRIAGEIVQGCSILHTEVLNHGQTIDGVQIINPFRVDEPKPA